MEILRQVRNARKEKGIYMIRGRRDGRCICCSVLNPVGPASAHEAGSYAIKTRDAIGRCMEVAGLGQASAQSP